MERGVEYAQVKEQLVKVLFFEGIDHYYSYLVLLYQIDL